MRQYLLLTLTLSYTILWIGGEGWHAVTCCHHASGDVAGINHCEHGCHHHSSQQDESPEPKNPEHDPNDCPVCQWFGQALSPIEITTPQKSEPFLGTVPSIEIKVTLAPVSGLQHSRGPPA